jgi:hypothetical protein
MPSRSSCWFTAKSSRESTARTNTRSFASRVDTLPLATSFRRMSEPVLQRTSLPFAKRSLGRASRAKVSGGESPKQRSVDQGGEALAAETSEPGPAAVIGSCTAVHAVDVRKAATTDATRRLSMDSETLANAKCSGGFVGPVREREALAGC